MRWDTSVLPEVEGRFKKLLDAMDRSEPYGTVAAEARRIIQDHESDGWNGRALFRKGWEDEWRGPEPRFCSTNMVGLFDPDDSRQEVALTELGRELVRFVSDSTTPYHQRKNTASLSGALCAYLALRGYDVLGKKAAAGKGASGGKKGRGAPMKKETQQRADFAKPLVAKGLTWPEISGKYAKTVKGKADKTADADAMRQAYHRRYPPE
jgi:hypothetical protein